MLSHTTENDRLLLATL